MTKLNSQGVDPFKILTHFAKLAGDSVYDEKSFSYTHLREDVGEGVVTAAKVSSEISVLTFDVVFKDDFELHFAKNSGHCIDFIFCLEGSVFHKFDKGGFEQVNFRQNYIVSRNKTSPSTLRFPSHTPLQMTLISFWPDSDKSLVNDSVLRNLALSILSDSYLKDNYRYAGRICFRTSNYVKDILAHSFKTPSEILFKEAAIINTLASQIDRHVDAINSDYNNAPIMHYEIDRILALENFINDNLPENLSITRLQKISGLSPSKLQKGFQYLYNKTVNAFVTEKRLEKAALLISETELNVSEVVYSVGFSSRSYFSKIFKNHFGISPSKCLLNPNMLSTTKA